jgi:hypothetical protein
MIVKSLIPMTLVPIVAFGFVDELALKWRLYELRWDFQESTPDDGILL